MLPSHGRNKMAMRDGWKPATHSWDASADAHSREDASRSNEQWQHQQWGGQWQGDPTSDWDQASACQSAENEERQWPKDANWRRDEGATSAEEEQWPQDFTWEGGWDESGHGAAAHSAGHQDQSEWGHPSRPEERLTRQQRLQYGAAGQERREHQGSSLQQQIATLNQRVQQLEEERRQWLQDSKGCQEQLALERHSRVELEWRLQFQADEQLETMKLFQHEEAAAQQLQQQLQELQCQKQDQALRLCMQEEAASTAMARQVQKHLGELQVQRQEHTMKLSKQEEAASTEMARQAQKHLAELQSQKQQHAACLEQEQKRLATVEKRAAEWWQRRCEMEESYVACQKQRDEALSELEEMQKRLQSLQEPERPWSFPRWLSCVGVEKLEKPPGTELGIQDLSRARSKATEELSQLQERIQAMHKAADAVAGPTWKFESSEGVWASYSRECSAVLMRAWERGDEECRFQHGGTSYVVDLSLMRQMNVKTGTCRKVRCFLGVPPHWLQDEERNWVRIAGQTAPRRWAGAFLTLEDIQVPILDKEKLRLFSDLLAKCRYHATQEVPGAPCPGMKPRFQVNRAYHVENLPLFYKYQTYCQQMHAEIQATPPRIDVGEHLEGFLKECDGAVAKLDVNEVFLFHGTCMDIVGEICLQGFDLRLAREQSYYGKGIYFARQSCKSVQYAKTKTSEQCIIISRVALGRPHAVTAVSAEWRRPPGGADCLIAWSGPMDRHPAKVQTHDEFIVFQSNQAYPEYVLYFT